MFQQNVPGEQEDEYDSEDERLYRAYVEQQEAMLRQQAMQEAYFRQQQAMMEQEQEQAMMRRQQADSDSDSIASDSSD